MEAFFFNPNLAYLILVAGFALTLLAILSPGTGLLELGAFFMLVLAGWIIYQVPINYWALIVLLLGIVPFTWAVKKSRRLIFLALSILMMMIGSVFLFRGDAWWDSSVNAWLALVVSILMGSFFWIVARKSIEASQAIPAHDLGQLIGAIGEAKSDIHKEGSAQVHGELWTVRSEQPIAQGMLVRVIAREGFVLEVEPAEESGKA